MRPGRDMRAYARGTQLRLIAGGLFLALVVGSLLIRLIYGPDCRAQRARSAPRWPSFRWA